MSVRSRRHPASCSFPVCDPLGGRASPRGDLTTWPCHPSTGSLERGGGHTECACSREPGRRGAERPHRVLRGHVFSVGPRDLPLLTQASAMMPPPEVALPSFRFPKSWGPDTLYHGVLASRSARQSPRELGKWGPASLAAQPPPSALVAPRE